MDHNSIIDRKTYEVTIHAEDNLDVFICDKMIAPAIAELNKRGYETVASCSGHYRVEFYEWFDEDITNLEEYQKNDRIIIKKVKENSFDYWSEVDNSLIYVLFAKHYNFQSLPDGFSYYINDDDRTCIECQIDYYDKHNEKKKRYIVENEIEKKCKLHKNWADNLPMHKRKE